MVILVNNKLLQFVQESQKHLDNSACKIIIWAPTGNRNSWMGAPGVIILMTHCTVKALPLSYVRGPITVGRQAYI